ncbi:MAG: hypothetical protein K2Y27_19620 [Xanthobacteraceae bacterium]|nr:hypothetical protein [Xanthobacteraceae bacterium]
MVWYTGQFYALFFLLITLKLEFVSAHALIAVSLLVGTPFFIFFGWLSDRIGRLKIILAGCAIAAVTYFPLFSLLTHYVNPDLEAFQKKNQIAVIADTSKCNFHIFVGPWSNFTPATAPRTSSPSSASRSRPSTRRARATRSRCRSTTPTSTAGTRRPGRRRSPPPAIRPRPTWPRSTGSWRS